MKHTLSKYSFTGGIIIWLVSLAGIALFNKYYSVENPIPNAIFMPGTFETVLIILCGSIATGLGFIASVTAIRTSGSSKLSWAAITVNGLYCIPVLIILMMQAIQ